jgi:TrpR-related protein YerC/YecD
MARYNANRVPYTKQEEFTNTFCEVVCGLKTKSAVRDFFKDLLNRHERLMLARRLLVAELLLEGKTYREIQNQLQMGPSTIARIDRWLHFGRGGYKLAIQTKKQR